MYEMRGKLALMQIKPTGSSAYNSMQGAAGATPAGGAEVIVPRFRRIAPWMMGLAAVLLAGPAAAQGNLDAGKSPAQIFFDTCAGCHRSPGQVRRASASFLRSHYTTGPDEASAMARYLANVPNEPRPVAGQQKKGASPKETPAETATAARRGEAKEQAKGPAGSSRGRRAGTAEAKSSATASAAATPEAKPPEAPAESAPPPPPLDPFEE
jgi:mono/diheme cytochrome c family protein